MPGCHSRRAVNVCVNAKSPKEAVRKCARHAATGILRNRQRVVRVAAGAKSNPYAPIRSPRTNLVHDGARRRSDAGQHERRYRPEHEGRPNMYKALMRNPGPDTWHHRPPTRLLVAPVCRAGTWTFPTCRNRLSIRLWDRVKGADTPLIPARRAGLQNRGSCSSRTLCLLRISVTSPGEACWSARFRLQVPAGHCRQVAS